jgi:hypothetical protein
MTNSAYLVGVDDPEPARPLDSDGGYSYTQFDVETLASANYAIPVLWLFCFETGSLVSYDASDLNNGRPWAVASTGLRWFDTDSQADVAGYDAITYHDATNSDAGTMARGYRCGRRVPWNSEPGG